MRNIASNVVSSMAGLGHEPLPLPTVGFRWHLVYSKPRQERKARENLQRQGVEVFMPEIRVRRRRRGKFHQLREPLFPCYLFVRVPQRVSITTVRSSFGVANIVRFGGNVAEIPPQMIEDIRRASERDDGILIDEVPVSGDRVQITSGNFEGLEGLFQHTDGRYRCYVLLNFLGQNNKIRMALNNVKKTG